MPLTLTGAVQYSVRYNDAGGTERRVTLLKGDDAEALGLPAETVEELRALKRSSSPDIYFFTDSATEPNVKLKASVKPSKREADVPASTISMTDMKRSIAETKFSTKVKELQLNDAARKAHADQAAAAELPSLEAKLPADVQERIDRATAKAEAEAAAAKQALDQTEKLAERLVEKVEEEVAEVKAEVKAKTAKPKAKTNRTPANKARKSTSK